VSSICVCFKYSRTFIDHDNVVPSYMYYDYSGVDVKFEIAFLKINWERAHIPFALFQKYEVTRKLV